MRLSDVMSHAGLSGFAVIAMVLFLAAFLAIVLRTFRRGAKSEMDAMSRLPLEDDRPATPREAPPSQPARGGASR